MRALLLLRRLRCTRRDRRGASELTEPSGAIDEISAAGAGREVGGKWVRSKGSGCGEGIREAARGEAVGRSHGRAGVRTCQLSAQVVALPVRRSGARSRADVRRTVH
eukprot:6191810-Pleurochrysis_carterae.AAC.1